MILFLIELIFIILWVPPYFRNGISFPPKSYRIPLMFDLEPHVEMLENALIKGSFRPPVVFKPFNKNEFGFRNKLTSQTLFCGIICLESNNGRIRVAGKLPMMYPLLIMMGIILAIIGTHLYIFSGYILFGSVSIFIQWRNIIAFQKFIFDTLKNEGLILDDTFATY